MKTTKILCDGCGFELTNSKVNPNGVYRITHESCLGESIWGDNRVPNALDYCKSCFDEIYKSLLAMKPSKEGQGLDFN